MLKSWRFICINAVFLVASQKKSKDVKLHDLLGHDEKLRSREISLAIKPYLLELYGMWHCLVETTYSQSRIVQYQAKKKSVIGPKDQLHVRTNERSKQWLVWPLFNCLKIPKTATVTIFFINIPTECEMSVLRLFFKHLFHVVAVV